MPIVRVASAAPIELLQEAFSLERELEDLVTASPGLLASAGDPRIAFVNRQVALPGAGILDALLVDDAGTPVAVEAKLGRNGESRREVVGQVIDYVSVLTSMTVDELDQAVSGALETALKQLAGQGNDYRFEELWRTVGTKLRAGAARYIVLVDEAPNELERIIRFLAERSNLDISLVSLTRYRDGSGHIIVPQFLVRPASEPAPRTLPPELQAAINAYDNAAPLELRTRGRSPSYRQILPPGWRGIHYEFVACANAVNVELHIEGDAALAAAAVLKSLQGPAHSEFAFALEWDPSWAKGRGRLRTKLPNNDATTAAQAMVALISFTRERVTAAIAASGGSASA